MLEPEYSSRDIEKTGDILNSDEVISKDLSPPTTPFGKRICRLDLLIDNTKSEYFVNTKNELVKIIFKDYPLKSSILESVINLMTTGRSPRFAKTLPTARPI